MTRSDDYNPYPDGSVVRVRFPLSREQERGARDSWPWLPGTILEQCEPDEWQVLVEHPDLAEQDENGEITYPAVYRCAEEIQDASDHDS